jgi:hypothetical protein
MGARVVGSLQNLDLINRDTPHEIQIVSLFFNLLVYFQENKKRRKPKVKIVTLQLNCHVTTFDLRRKSKVKIVTLQL